MGVWVDWVEGLGGWLDRLVVGLVVGWLRGWLGRWS